MENVLLANPWFPLQAYIFRPKGRGITPKLLLKLPKSKYLNNLHICKHFYFLRRGICDNKVRYLYNKDELLN